MKEAIVATACAVTMALSGFSAFKPKSDTILGPGAASAQEAGGRWERSQERAYKIIEKHGAHPAIFTRMCRSYLEDLKTGDASKRIDAVEGLWYPCLGPRGNYPNRAYSAVARALTDSDPGVRVAAADALMHIVDESVHEIREMDDMRFVVPDDLDIRKAVPPLIRALGSAHAKTRANIAHTLGRIGDDRAYGRLAEVSRKDADKSVRDAAAEALRTIERVNRKEDTSDPWLERSEDGE